MQRRRALPRYLGPLLATALLLCGLVPSMTAEAARTASPSVDVFYAATTAAYDTWNADTSDSPPQPAHTASFAAGTRTVAFYFEFDGATSDSSSFAVVVKDSAGKVVGNSDSLTASSDSGSAMQEVDAPNGTYPAGTYRAGLTVDEHQVASTTFSVNSTSIAKAKAAVSSFYAATDSAYDRWTASTTKVAPGKSTSFQSDTAIIGFYAVYNNAIAKSTKLQIVVYDESGDVYAHNAPFAISYKNGRVMKELSPDSDDTYRDGTYTAVIWLDGHTSLRTTFNVGAAG